MDKAYSRINWQNQPSTTTALGATNLNKIDIALSAVDDRVITLDTAKANLSTVNAMVKDVALNSANGVITITYQNGTTMIYDTKLEKLAVNFGYDASTEELVFVLDDGTEQRVDISSLITEYEFENSPTVGFSVTAGKVKAEVPDGSITGLKLQPDYLADVTLQAETATAQASLSKRYAVGGVETGDEVDNAKYYQEQAKIYKDQAQAIVNIDIATDTVAGLVKGGGNVTIEEDGTMNAPEGGGGTAKTTTYNNTISELLAEDVQDAIDEVNDKVESLDVMTTEGDILYHGATVPARLAKGTAGQVLTINNTATAPEWKTPTGGGSGTVTFLIDATNPPSPLVAVKTDGTDTSTEINAILTYANVNNIKTVYLPKSVSVASTVIIPANVELIGGGFNSIAITGITSSMTVVRLSDYNTRLKDVQVVAYGQTGIAVDIRDSDSSGVADFMIEGVKTVGGLWGIWMQFCWNGSIRNCRIMGGANGIRCDSQTNQVLIDTTAVKCKTAIMYFTNSSGIKIMNCELTHFEPSDNAKCFNFDGACHNNEFDTIYMEGMNSTAIFASIDASNVSGMSQINFKNIICISTLKYLMNITNSASTYPRQISFENCNILLSTALYLYYNVKNFNCIYKNCNFGTVVNAVKEDALLPTYQNSWTYFDVHSICGFWLDSENNVHMMGVLKAGTSTATMFTLPERYRPVQQCSFTTMSGGAIARIVVNTDGTVYKPTGTTTDVVMDGIVFLAA